MDEFGRKFSKREQLDAEKRRWLRENILEAAEALIIENGVAKLRARDIAERAGCSVGSLYTAYENFDDIVLHVNSRTLVDLGKLLRSISELKRDQSAADRLVAMALCYLNFALDNRNRWAALFEHRMPNEQPIPDWHLSEHLELIAIIDGPISDILPNMDRDQRLLLCRTLYSAVHGIVSIGSENRMGRLDDRVLYGQIELAVRSFIGGIKTLV